MYQSMLILSTRTADAFAELVAGYRRERVIEAALPFGIIRSEAVTVENRPLELIVASLWPTRAHYDAWLASDARARVTEWMPSLLDPGVPPRIETALRAEEADHGTSIDFGEAVMRGGLQHLITVVASD